MEGSLILHESQGQFPQMKPPSPSPTKAVKRILFLSFLKWNPVKGVQPQCVRCDQNPRKWTQTSRIQFRKITRSNGAVNHSMVILLYIRDCPIQLYWQYIQPFTRIPFLTKPYGYTVLKGFWKYAAPSLETNRHWHFFSTKKNLWKKIPRHRADKNHPRNELSGGVSPPPFSSSFRPKS